MSSDFLADLHSTLDSALALAQGWPWHSVADVASWLLIGAGGVLSVVAGIGMVRLPDLYTRIHAASVADTGGMLLIFFGLMIQAGLGLVTVKLALIVIFLLITGPTATHALARAARHDGVGPDPAPIEQPSPERRRP